MSQIRVHSIVGPSCESLDGWNYGTENIGKVHWLKYKKTHKDKDTSQKELKNVTIWKFQ